MMSQTHIIQRAWRCFGKECQSIIDILNQDAMTWDIKQLITIYIPRTVGVAAEDKPYLDWMEDLIHDFKSPPWRPI